jgi:ferritin-like metal-binding protein YciE
MPKMIETVGAGDIKNAFEDHLKEAEEQIKILKKVFATVGQPAEGEKCDAIEDFIEMVRQSWTAS